MTNILLTSAENGSWKDKKLHLAVRRRNDSNTSSRNSEAALLTTSQALSGPFRYTQQEGDGAVSSFSTKDISSIQSLSNLKELQEALNAFYSTDSDVHNNNSKNNNTVSDSNSDGTTSSISTEDQATEEEEKRFELFRQVITHEDGLLNERVSWILLAQSFLMAPYVLAGDEPYSLRFVTASVGIVSVFVTLPSILAAGTNVEVQQQVYFRQVLSDERCQQLHGHGRDLKLCLPNSKEEQDRRRYGHLLPSMAFRSKGGVRILITALALAVIQFVGWIFLLAAVILEWD